MKKVNKIILICAGLLIGFISCKDDSLQIVPDWETGVNTYATRQTGSSASFVNGSPATPLNLNFRWISIDGANTVTKIEFFLTFDEGYVDVDNNPALAKHGGSAGKLFKTIEGAAVPANRADVGVTITQNDVYQLYKNNKYNYCGTEVDVFSNTLKPARTPSSPFLAGDVFSLKWIVYTADGRKFDSWSPSVCNEFPGSNCKYAWGVVCDSNLGGTYNYSTTSMFRAGAPFAGNPTGSGTATEGSEGSYTLTDFSFGVFAAAYGDSPALGSLRLSDACDFLSIKGTDQYGDSYTITVMSVTSTVLTIKWVNTYGDGGTTTLTRSDSKTWPTTLTTSPSGSCN
ncbi:MAG: hypothetical protein JNM78_10355 [Cyclobacteriaceae bacterium]|nr:hypothetical protein [Cyclobacteriaceae bacterium]